MIMLLANEQRFKNLEAEPRILEIQITFVSKGCFRFESSGYYRSRYENWRDKPSYARISLRIPFVTSQATACSFLLWL
jgi:hypothetical protein